jgi:hypothetical protein
VDAQAVIAVVEAWGARPRRLVRSALTSGWESPRYPRPLVLRGVKLPAPWPWSSEARRVAQRAADEGRPTRPQGLVHGHVQPIGAVVAAVVEDPALRDADALSAFLFEWLTYAVVTVVEDRLLTEADRAGIVHDGDPWARYRAAGLDVETFAPLNASRTRQGSRRSAMPGERACGEPDCDRPTTPPAFAGFTTDGYGGVRGSARAWSKAVRAPSSHEECAPLTTPKLKIEGYGGRGAAPFPARFLTLCRDTRRERHPHRTPGRTCRCPPNGRVLPRPDRRSAWAMTRARCPRTLVPIEGCRIPKVSLLAIARATEPAIGGTSLSYRPGSLMSPERSFSGIQAGRVR